METLNSMPLSELNSEIATLERKCKRISSSGRFPSDLSYLKAYNNLYEKLLIARKLRESLL